MKNFVRDDLSFSLCGLNCALCTMKIGGYCPGCGGGEGNMGCAIAACSIKHGGYSYCFECAEYPCSRYEGITKFDSFITHRNRSRSIRGCGARKGYCTKAEQKMTLPQQARSFLNILQK